MRVEKMSANDLQAVAKLAAQLGYPNSVEEVEKRFSEIHKQEDYALFVAKSDANEVLGWVQINAESTSLLVGPRADVAALVVDEKCRSQGIGRALTQIAEKWAQSKHLTLIRVRSNISRQEAHRFYQREGYDLSKTAYMFTKTLVDDDSKTDIRPREKVL
jgi:ribosomal protein S18 acetylase RimI-like enzyme